MANVLNVESNGRVGIGTGNPGYTLDVAELERGSSSSRSGLRTDPSSTSAKRRAMKSCS